MIADTRACFSVSDHINIPNGSKYGQDVELIVEYGADFHLGGDEVRLVLKSHGDIISSITLEEYAQLVLPKKEAKELNAFETTCLRCNPACTCLDYDNGDDEDVEDDNIATGFDDRP